MKCPGQDSRFWGKEAIFEAACPKCSSIVEFFKDEPSRRCSRCGYRFVNPRMDFGCAAYCRFAEECLGVLTPELIAKRESLMKDRVAIEAKKRLGRDFRAVSRAIKAARYAEEIFRREKLDNPSVIIATYLFELPKERGQEAPSPEESAEEARKLLDPIVPKKDLIDEVVSLILSQNKPREELSSIEAIFSDAVSLARFEEEIKKDPCATVPFLVTDVGREIAQRIQDQSVGTNC